MEVFRGAPLKTFCASSVSRQSATRTLASRHFGGSVQSHILLGDSAFAAADELDEVPDFRQRWQFAFNLQQRVENGKFFAE